MSGDSGSDLCFSYAISFKRPFFADLLRALQPQEDIGILGTKAVDIFVLCFVIGFGVCVGLLVLLSPGMSIGQALLVYFTGFGAYILFTWHMQKRAYRRMHHAMEGDYHYEIDAYGIRIRSDNLASQVAWSYVLAIKSYQDGLVFALVDPYSFVPLPDEHMQGMDRQAVPNQLKAWHGVT